jgi:hypothetical protein
MTDLQPGDVARALAPHAATVGFALDEATVLGWMIALHDGLVADGIPPVTLEELTTAVAVHMRSNRFRMTPADAWALIRESRRKATVEAEAERWMRAVEQGHVTRGEVEG